MARLVIPRSPASGQLAGTVSVRDLPPDSYKDRLVKYIPAESIALYTFADKLVISHYGIDATGAITGAPADGLLTVVAPLLFFLGLVGTPAYLWRQRLSRQPWKLHALISTIAFAVWAYTLGGSWFLVHHWYHSLIAALSAPIFTFVAGAIEPQAE